MPVNQKVKVKLKVQVNQKVTVNQNVKVKVILPLPLREGVGGKGAVPPLCRPLPPTPSRKGRGRLQRPFVTDPWFVTFCPARGSPIHGDGPHCRRRT